MRKNTKLIPGKKEFFEILQKEAKRDLPKSKENIHYPDFSLIRKLFKVYKEDELLFIKKFNQTNFINEVKKTLNDLVKKILDDKNIESKKPLFDKIYNYLSEEDEPQKSDLIFVFAAPTLFRAEKANELYRQGLAPLIMLSGHAPFYQSKKISEALEYRNFLIKGGTPKDSLIIEEESITIPDNVRSSLNRLDELKIKFKSLILINSPYVQRRGWAHFKKYLSDGITICRVNSNCGQEYKKENWFSNEAGIRAILNEFVKMKIAVILNTA